MNEIWNSWDLKPPPVCTVKMVLHHKEIRSLIEVVSEAFATMSNIKCLNREAALLSRLLYKNKRMFRHDKAFQNLSKMHQCLKRYLKLNLLDVLHTFRTSLPKGIKGGTTHAYLPSRQMLRWVLFRLLAFSQIFARVIRLSKETGKHLYKKLHLGWQTSLSLVVYSLTARLLVVSKFLVMKSIEWYSALYKYLPYLEETAEFLPEFTLPINLKKWLGDVDISPLQKKTSIDEVFEVIDLAKDEDDVRVVSENLFRDFSVVKEIDSDVEEEVQVTINSVEDLGVPVTEEEVVRKELSKKRQRTKDRAKWSTKRKKESAGSDMKHRTDVEIVDVND